MERMKKEWKRLVQLMNEHVIYHKTWDPMRWMRQKIILTLITHEMKTKSEQIK